MRDGANGGGAGVMDYSEMAVSSEGWSTFQNGERERRGNRIPIEDRGRG